MDGGCDLKRNKEKLDAAKEERDLALRTTERHSRREQEAWGKFWSTARTIKPCRCDACEADKVLRAISQEKFESIYDEILHNGW